MSKKRWDRHPIEPGKHEPQGSGAALDREQPGHSQASHHATERNDHPHGHGHYSRHADYRSEDGHWRPYGELHYAEHGSRGFDLAQAAVEELHEAGFKPEFGPDVQEQVSEIERGVAHWRDAPKAADLRGLGWSSIDNDTSKDLDQIEVAERVPTGIRVHVAIGDVAAAVGKGSPVDDHAQNQTQTIYTAVKNFPMLPFELSAGLTSLNENEDRLAITMSFTVAANGELLDETVSRSRVRNRAQLAYSRVGPWLDAGGKDTKSVVHLRSDSAREHDSDDAASARMDGESSLPVDWLAEQLKLQDQATRALHRTRVAAGALDFHKAEAEPVLMDGHIASVHEVTQNRAMHLIEDLMVAANGVMARALRKGGRSGLQRVVKTPERWNRIVALAQLKGTTLPEQPDSVQLNRFLQTQRESDPDHYPDLALAVIKLMGPGEYMLMRAEDDPTGHFGLAARDYTHSTAPNRRFPDLVTQRVLHAMMDDAPPPYTDGELAAIAEHCNEADKALRKIERRMQKRVAAVAMSGRVGEVFKAVVTGSSEKGVYARVLEPPFEGRVVEGERGLDVGDVVRVKLIHTDPARAFIDLARM
ncbi:MAG TPA: RNB domain-containing ribonuclease [Acidobacteriaceae bacterium]|nr:RNB domain-containing ribonuclease [Acidobacteriaceae bacterium]